MPKLTARDLEWQAQADADTMARYEEIINDKARKMRAMREARKQANDLTKRAAAMQKAGGAAGKKRK